MYKAYVPGDHERYINIRVPKNTPRNVLQDLVAKEIVRQTGDSYATGLYIARASDIWWEDPGDIASPVHNHEEKRMTQSELNFGESLLDPKNEDVSTSKLVEDAMKALDEEKLSASKRSSLPKGDFALGGKRYPINDLAHARNALSRVSQHGNASEQKRVRAAVYAKFPGLKKRKQERD